MQFVRKLSLMQLAPYFGTEDHCCTNRLLTPLIQEPFYICGDRSKEYIARDELGMIPATRRPTEVQCIAALTDWLRSYWAARAYLDQTAALQALRADLSRRLDKEDDDI